MGKWPFDDLFNGQLVWSATIQSFQHEKFAWIGFRMQLFLLLILHIQYSSSCYCCSEASLCCSGVCCRQYWTYFNIWWTNARMKNCISENKSAPAAHSERWPDANAAADCCRPAASCPNLNNLVFYFYFQQTDYKLYKLTV